MGKQLFIAEKPSVAQEFAKVLKMSGRRGDGFIESEKYVVTWCVGHLVTMSYPDKYDENLKKWSFDTIPFIPEKFKYEIISDVKKQFNTVKSLLLRDDVEAIYVCTDSGREGEYIYRLVDMMAGVPDSKAKYRVWIDSQTEEEILRGIREAKSLSEYDNISASAYLRAKEDYLMGINFSRALSIKYGNWLNKSLDDGKWTSVSVGRVMTCVLGMVVSREWEIRNFQKTPFYRVIADFGIEDKVFSGEWKVTPESKYHMSPALYKDNGFKDKENALGLVEEVKNSEDQCIIQSVNKKKEKKNPPLLFNLAELQNISSKLFKISPDETLGVVQELYEKKLVTYPRTDARVLSTAVAKEITNNLKGLQNYPMALPIVKKIAEMKSYENLAKTRYVDDKKITDHYAIIPTGQGLNALNSLKPIHVKMYEVIMRRFLSIFFPPAEYQKVNIDISKGAEHFFTSTKVLVEEGFLPVSKYSFVNRKEDDEDKKSEDEEFESVDLKDILDLLKKGTVLDLKNCNIKEGATTPPKRYKSGTMILAMENAGQLIEDEELRAQIKGSGIGTSATRAEILKKLVKIGYMKLEKKTQTISPTLKGELVYCIVRYSMPAMLSPELTASWEKGLNGVAEGNITEDEYMSKLSQYVKKLVGDAKNMNNLGQLASYQRLVVPYYNNGGKKNAKNKK
ncbi:MAG: type IA DNA topoisomerase [Eubacterium sp.]|nr:type IA DNA topoisomerase [Eubacterium sp.]